MDAIGPNTFIRLSRPPQRAQTEWEPVARGGIDGVALWDTGARGEAFQLESLAVAVTYAAGRAYIFDYLALVGAGPVPVVYGTLEQDQLYKVLRVELLGVKRVIRAHVANDPTTYGALVTALWTLLPVDPSVQRP